ncbi:MAG: hypothetical protein KF862_19800 [Chitinophagaceae bacterium]|nr:hypothetical protein [Chitinophagaceae bacterium]
MSQVLWGSRTVCACIGVLIVALSLLSCKKGGEQGDPGSEYYVRFKANGTRIEYKAYAEGNFNKLAGGKYASTLSGLKENFVGTKNNMSISLATASPNSTDVTYTNFSASSAGLQKAELLSLGYFDDNGKFFMTWAEELAPALPATVETEARLIFTEQTDKYLKGKFSGKMYNDDFSVKLDITDGEFYVKRIP